MRKLSILLAVIFFVGFAHVLAAKQHLPWDLKIRVFNGDKELKFEDFKGKVLLVNFFATYCPPCQVELLEFTDLYRKFNGQGLEIISFMVDQGGERVLPHLIHSKGIKYYVAIADEAVLSAFEWPDVLPTTFLVDQNGQIVKKFVGYAGKRDLEKAIIELLNRKSSETKG
ncbi:MAG: TlpA family protein disulfide reductase [Thermodesulfobacteria bacterium]|nr:TlpA family protein disulfide reductase [Thermodesulfobacteriota bacterium]